MLSADDQQLVKREEAIPGLRLLLDPDATTEYLPRRHWQEADAVYIAYLRYKPQTSCLALLRGRFSDREELAYAVAFAKSQCSKIDKSLVKSPPGATSILHDYCLATCCFPHDRRLPSLRRLVHADERLLARLLPAECDATEVSLETLRYKPERRYVGRIEFRGETMGKVKLYSRDSYRFARGAHKILGDSNRRGESRFLGHSNRHAAVSFAWQAGESLSDNGLPDAIGFAGGEIAALHARSAVNLPRHDQATFVKRLHRTRQFLCWLIPELSAEVLRVSDAILPLIQDAGCRQTVLHGDLHLDQFIVADDAVSIIDFDRACLGPPEWDLANLCVDLQLRANDEGSKINDPGQAFETFIDGYHAAGGRVDRKLLRALSAFRTFESAVEPFRSRAAEWKNLTQHILKSTGEYVQAASDGGSGVTFQPDPFAVSVSATTPVLDVKLPWLVDACDVDRARERLRHLDSDGEVRQGIDLQRLRLVRYKPGRRCLIKYEGVSRSSGARISLLGKMEHKPRHAERLGIQRKLWDAGFDSSAPDGISVARPWGSVPEWNMWLQERVPGLDGWTAFATLDPSHVARLAARAIKKLHNSNLATGRIHTFADECELLVDRLNRAAASLPSLRTRILCLRDDCLAVFDAIKEPEAAAIHRDFYPDQILIDGERVAIVDLDLFCQGPPPIDVGNFVAHLAELSIREHMDPYHFKHVEKTFVDEYGIAQDETDSTLVAACRLFTLARHVFISNTLLERQEHTPHILEWCEELATAAKGT